MKRKNQWKYNNKNSKLKYTNEDSESDDDESDNAVWCDDNHIFFYADVNNKNIAELNKFIFQINKESNINSYNLKNVTIETYSPPIFLHIKSYGGCVLSALSTIDLIKTSKCPIYTIIEGYAASAATMISIVGKKRFMHKNAQMLIHQMSSSFWGKMEEIKDEMKNLKELEKIIRKIYKENTSIPNEKYKDILKHDLWWNSTICLKYKLIDEIINN